VSETIAVTRLDSLSASERRRRRIRASAVIFGEEMRTYARRILDAVARDGDAAVARYTREWDRVELSAEQFAVREEDFETARATIDPAVRRALEAMIGRVRRFNEWLRPRPDATTELEPGVSVGVRYSAVESAGVYVPSGKGSFPSSFVMLAVPAVTAGVETLAAVVPPRADGSVDPAILVAADLIGVRRIFRCNGPAGIAAMAIGTGSIPRTAVVVGPGNPVTAAVQMAAAAYGARPIVLLGPSEAVILADESADPSCLALDLLNEAEHGGDSAATLLVTDEALAFRVAAAATRWAERLPEPRRRFALRALTDLGGIFVAHLGDAIAWINEYAPEHLQLAVRDPGAVSARIRHAGEILLGQYTPFAAANYAIGVPHALPTGGWAAAASGVSVLAFMKTTFVAGLTADGLRTVAPVAAALGRHEGFPAHVQAITERERKGDA
jgi:histidinol dehydrogenase